MPMRSAVVVLVALLWVQAGAALGRPDLSSAGGMSRPVDMAGFTPPQGAALPINRLEGTLTLGPSLSGKRVILDAFGIGPSASWQTLPDFAFDFIQDGARLIPVRRGAIANAHPYWEFVLEPGAVWDEPGDGGFSRAVIPFSLQQKNANCLHNGVLTFLFRSSGETSRAAFQIAGETCAYFKFDLWGDAPLSYRPGRVGQGAAVVAADRALLAARLPVKPIADLVARYPAAAGFGSAAEVKPENMTSFGVVMDGVFYTGGCATRHGAYPLCTEMSLPSFSTAKSLAGAIGLMRLERLYPGASEAMVADLVPACAKAGTWAGVRLVDALDMATGNYIDPGSEVDEVGQDAIRFLVDPSHKGKIAIACGAYPRRAAPGTRWVYHTTDTYVLGTAMAAYVKAQGGGDMFDTLVAPVWRAVGVSAAALVPRRTDDGVRQPLMGYGLTLQRDDFARLGLFLARGDGKAGGQVMLAPAMLQAALQRDPAQPGLKAFYDGLRYQNGIWAWNVGPVLGCKGETWIPFLAGYGGILVALMPNGMVYVRISDGGDIAWAEGAKAANAIRRFCKA